MTATHAVVRFLRGRHDRLRRLRRGSAMVEFALGFGLLLPIFAGVSQFGYNFYVYNMLETAVRNGARYASLAAYDEPNGTNFHDRVKRMTVYGDPDAPTSATPLLAGLSTANVIVTEEKNGVMPVRITVRLNNFVLSAPFGSITLQNKPSCRFDYMGQLLSP